MGKIMERRAGIDVGKRFLLCCVLTGAGRSTQARMVSGLATQATPRSALRPSRFPISARVARSGSLNRNVDGNFAP